MASCTIEVMPDYRLSKNRTRSTHWAILSSLTKQAREDAYILGLVERPDGWETPEKATISVTQYYARRPLDYDGLACAVAPSIDGLVDAGILTDDDPLHVMGYAMRHEKVRTVGENRIAITVTPVSE